MTDKDQAVQMRAYELWDKDGRPEGKAEEYWLQAERELGMSPSDLVENPAGPGETTAGGEALNEATPSGGINPAQRGRAGK